MRTLTVFLLLMLVVPGLLMAGTLQRSYEFGNVTITPEAGYDRLELEGAPTMADPGNPLLPLAARYIVLPQGEELAEIRVLNAVWEPIPGSIVPLPASTPVPIGSGETIRTSRNTAVYNGNQVYPALIADNIQTGFLRGFGVGSFLIHPVRWDPVTSRAERLSSISLELVTQPSRKAVAARRFLRGGRSTISLLRSLTDDLAEVSSYETALDELDEVDPALLIICPANHQQYWEDYAQFKRQRGMETIILTTSDIYNDYEGVDNAEKVRNAIIDIYSQYDLEHVLLGGDVAQVPYRGMWVEAWAGGDVDENMPSDLYYAALDGSWNDDGDNRWGEPGEDDLFQEITVGRATTTNAGMIESWTAKQMLYQAEPVADQMTNAMMVGEELGWSDTGGDYKDEIRFGSNNYGYSTAGFPLDWDVQTLYDRDNVWSIPDLFNRLNNGVHFVNHLGHANVTYALKASNNDINDVSLTNDGIDNTRYLLYTQGCYCGAFEQNCILERWNTIANGAFAVIGNSRYGWGSGGDTNGASQRFDRQFFDAIFGENISILGEVNRDSKHDNIAYINISCMRWCYYEINLFGDPSVDLYTDTPVEIDFADLPEAYLIGQTELDISVPEAPDATVAILMDDELLAVGQTGGDGSVQIPLEIEQPGELTVNIIAHNRFPWSDTIPVVNADGPYPTVSECNVIDDEYGNGNGQADFGETFELEMSVVNLGQEAITGLTIEAMSGLDELIISDEPVQIGDLDPNETATVVFNAEAAVNVEDLLQVPVQVTFTSGEDTWQREETIRLHAPRLSLEILRVNDMADGNGNHRLDPGESSTVVVNVTNDGSADLNGANFEIYCDNPYITDVQPLPEPFDVPGEEARSLNGFTVTVSPDAPELYRAAFMISVVRDDGYLYRSLGMMDIGGFYDDVDGDVQPVSHYGIDESPDQWHISADRNWTTDGMFSWKCGGEGWNSFYLDNMDACLELPPIPRDLPALLSFRHWMEAEVSTQYPGECYDGGRVEISVDGENWIPVPMSGYNYTTRGNGPFGTGQAVYSGSIEWEEDSFLFTASPGDPDLHVRFRFGTDTGTNMDGWYLDNISITLGSSLEPPSELQAEVVDGGYARLSWTLPAPELDEADDLIGFLIYRNGESLGDPVVDITYDDPLADLEFGEYTYSVSALYTTGESMPSNEVHVIWDGNAVENTEAVAPREWALAPPFPNPFNPTVTLRVAVPHTAEIRLSVYDILGRETARIVRGELTAGVHDFTLNSATWASGIYFVRLETPGASYIRKMVLVR